MTMFRTCVLIAFLLTVSAIFSFEDQEQNDFTIDSGENFTQRMNNGSIMKNNGGNTWTVTESNSDPFLGIRPVRAFEPNGKEEKANRGIERPTTQVERPKKIVTILSKGYFVTYPGSSQTDRKSYHSVTAYPAAHLSRFLS